MVTKEYVNWTFRQTTYEFYTASTDVANRCLRSPNDALFKGESPVKIKKSYRNPPKRQPKKGATIGIYN